MKECNNGEFASVSSTTNPDGSTVMHVLCSDKEPSIPQCFPFCRGQMDQMWINMNCSFCYWIKFCSLLLDIFNKIWSNPVNFFEYVFAFHKNKMLAINIINTNTATAFRTVHLVDLQVRWFGKPLSYFYNALIYLHSFWHYESSRNLYLVFNGLIVHIFWFNECVINKW